MMNSNNYPSPAPRKHTQSSALPNRVQQDLDDVHIVIQSTSPFSHRKQHISNKPNLAQNKRKEIGRQQLWNGAGRNSSRRNNPEQMMSQGYHIEVQEQDGANIDVTLKFSRQYQSPNIRSSHIAPNRNRAINSHGTYSDRNNNYINHNNNSIENYASNRTEKTNDKGMDGFTSNGIKHQNINSNNQNHNINVSRNGQIYIDDYPEEQIQYPQPHPQPYRVHPNATFINNGNRSNVDVDRQNQNLLINYSTNDGRNMQIKLNDSNNATTNRIRHNLGASKDTQSIIQANYSTNPNDTQIAQTTHIIKIIDKTKCNNRHCSPHSGCLSKYQPSTHDPNYSSHNGHQSGNIRYNTNQIHSQNYESIRNYAQKYSSNILEDAPAYGGRDYVNDNGRGHDGVQYITIPAQQIQVQVPTQPQPKKHLRQKQFHQIHHRNSMDNGNGNNNNLNRSLAYNQIEAQIQRQRAKQKQKQVQRQAHRFMERQSQSQKQRQQQESKKKKQIIEETGTKKNADNSVSNRQKYQTIKITQTNGNTVDRKLPTSRVNAGANPSIKDQQQIISNKTKQQQYPHPAQQVNTSSNSNGILTKEVVHTPRTRGKHEQDSLSGSRQVKIKVQVSVTQQQQGGYNTINNLRVNSKQDYINQNMSRSPNVEDYKKNQHSYLEFDHDHPNNQDISQDPYQEHSPLILSPHSQHNNNVNNNRNSNRSENYNSNSINSDGNVNKINSNQVNKNNSKNIKNGNAKYNQQQTGEQTKIISYNNNQNPMHNNSDNIPATGNPTDPIQPTMRHSNNYDSRDNANITESVKGSNIYRNNPAKQRQKQRQTTINSRQKGNNRYKSAYEQEVQVQMQGQREPPNPFMYQSQTHSIRTSNFNNNLVNSGHESNNNSSNNNWPPSIKDIPIPNHNNYNIVGQGQKGNKKPSQNTSNLYKNTNFNSNSKNYNTINGTIMDKAKNKDNSLSNSNINKNRNGMVKKNIKNQSMVDNIQLSKQKQGSYDSPIVVPMSKIPHNFSTNLIKNGQTKQNKSVINNPYKNSIATQPALQSSVQKQREYRVPANPNSVNSQTKIIRISLNTADHKFYTQANQRSQRKHQPQNQNRNNNKFNSKEAENASKIIRDRYNQDKRQSKSKQKDAFTINKQKYLNKLRRQENSQLVYRSRSRSQNNFGQRKTFNHNQNSGHIHAHHHTYNNHSHACRHSMSPQCEQITNRLHQSRINRQPCQKYLQYKQTMNRLRMKQTLGQYNFIRRYLTDEEIFKILDELKDAGIPERKWPIRLIDIVYDKLRAFTTEEIL